MKRHTRPAAGALLSVIAVIALAACGSSSSNSSSSTSSAAASGSGTTSAPAKTGGTVTLLMGGAPQSLDPGMDYTTQGAEALWVTYTGLTTYAHAQGVAGSKLIPGLATALPTISNGGKTYTATLRKGLVFSNGKPVKASDFAWTVERAIKIPWGGSGAFLTSQIKGAQAFSNGKAKTISGIKTDNATGKITVNLNQPYGPFDNVLAFPVDGSRSVGHADEERADQPAPGRRALQDHQHRPEPGMGVGAQPRVRQGADPWHPRGEGERPGQAVDERPVERAVGAQQHRRRLRLGRHDPRQPAAADQSQGIRPLLAGQPRWFDLLHLHECDAEAVQQPARS